MSQVHCKKSEAARHWLSLGFDLLPIQSDTKFILKGFGIHQRRIKCEDEINQFWHDEKLNLAVVARDENFIIDFDNYAVYAEWARVTDERFTTSYTEMTPRGAHVFLCGDVVQGLKLREAVEVKKISIVSPSVVAGIPYESGCGKIYRGDVDDAFFSLSIPGTRSPYVLRIESAKHQHIEKPIKRGDDLIATIKENINLVDVFAELSPTKDTLTGSGRWISARCPFHKSGKESRSSFWMDAERGTFGCHTCNTRGDVINLFASLTGKPIPQAIQALKDKLVADGVQ